MGVKVESNFDENEMGIQHIRTTKPNTYIGISEKESKNQIKQYI
jgi:hypothetical protein